MLSITIILLVISVVKPNEHIDCFVKEFSKVKSNILFQNMNTFQFKNLFRKGIQNVISDRQNKNVIDIIHHKISKTNFIKKDFHYEFDFNMNIADLVEYIHSKNYYENKYYSDKISRDYCQNGFLKIGILDNKISKFFCQNSATKEIMGVYFSNNYSHHFYLIKVFEEAFRPFKKFYKKNHIIHYNVRLEKGDYSNNIKIKKKVLDGFDHLLENLKITIENHLQQYHKNIKQLLFKLEKEFNGSHNKFRKINIKDENTKEFFIRRMNINFSTLPKKVINKIIPILNRNILKFPIEKKVNDYYMHSYFNYVYRKTKQKNWNTNYYLKNFKEKIVITIVNFFSKLNSKYKNSKLNIFEELVTVIDELFDQFINKELNFDISLLEFNINFFQSIKVNFKYELVKFFNEKVKEKNYFLLSPENFRKTLIMLFKQTTKEEIEKLNKVIIYLKGHKIKNHEDLTLYLIFYKTLNHLPHLHKIVKKNILKHKSSKEIIENYEKFNVFYKETKDELYNVVDTVDSSIKYEIYFQYFMKRISYNIINRFPEHKELILTSIPHVFDKKVLNYKNIYIYYRLLNLKFKLAIENLDFLRNTKKNLKIYIVDVFRNIVINTNEEIFQINEYFKYKKKDFLEEFTKTQRSRFIFKYLYLNIIKINKLNLKAIPFDEREKSKHKEFTKILKDFKFYLYNKILNLKSDKKEIEIIKKFDIFKYNIDNNGLELEKIENNNKEIKIRDKFEIIQKLTSNSLYKNQKKEIEKSFKFLLEHYDFLPNYIKDIITTCGSLFKNNDQSEDYCKSSKNHKSKKCFRANPYLIVQSCYSNFPKIYKEECLKNCPLKFIEAGNGTCIKPEVYIINGNEKCGQNFERIENFCFPRCPFGWKDFGNSCQKGKPEKIKKYFHSDIIAYVK